MVLIRMSEFFPVIHPPVCEIQAGHVYSTGTADSGKRCALPVFLPGASPEMFLVFSASASILTGNIRDPSQIRLNLSMAALVASSVLKAVSLKYPSPQGPKPDPGVPTTPAFSRRTSKKSQLV